MNKTVSIETAEALRNAGFKQPEPFWGMQAFAYGAIRSVFVNPNGALQLSGIKQEYDFKQFYSVCIFAPTALDILERLTYAFLTKKADGMWQCSIKIGEGRAIFNSNTCPHEACAKTWIEWVNRNNEPIF